MQLIQMFKKQVFGLELAHVPLVCNLCLRAEVLILSDLNTLYSKRLLRISKTFFVYVDYIV